VVAKYGDRAEGLEIARDCEEDEKWVGSCDCLQLAFCAILLAYVYSVLDFECDQEYLNFAASP
jgi:hypothetical protein